MAGSQNDQGMGGGYGAQGSGVAGGYEGNQASQGQQAAGAQSGEKQDWLDKGITAAGKKFGYNIVSSVRKYVRWVLLSVHSRAHRTLTRPETSLIRSLTNMKVRL